ncbi:MAG TPA: hypothetical protein VF940_33720 [Streptosporangiaceae bacterium]
MNDLEDRLREVMSASVASAEPGFTIADVKRGHRRRRARMIAAVVVAVAAAVLAVMFVPWPLAGSLFGTGPAAPTAAPGRYVDPAYGWSIRYPRGVIVGHFREAGRNVAEGVRVTTFAPDLSAPSSGIPAMGWLRDFPANGVAVQIWTLQGPPSLPLLRDSRFPMNRSSFRHAPPYVGGSEPAPVYHSFQGNGFGFAVALWFGSQASNSSKSAAWVMLRSLRFPALTTGTIWRRTFYVLGKASSYPVGTVTAIPASALPRGPGFGKPAGFYLLHYPHGFYVIKKEFADPAHRYRLCPVVFDARANQFSCPGTGLRWDRDGLPLGPHANGGPDSALPLHIATIAQDGHVLFTPFFGPAPRADLPRIRQ